MSHNLGYISDATQGKPFCDLSNKIHKATQIFGYRLEKRVYGYFISKARRNRHEKKFSAMKGPN